MSANKRRRLDDGGDESKEEVVVERSGMVPTCLGSGPPLGLRSMGRWGGAPRVPEGLFMPRAYQFVDRSLLGLCNGMVVDSYHTRGGGTRAWSGGMFGGSVGRGNRPYR